MSLAIALFISVYESSRMEEREREREKKIDMNFVVEEFTHFPNPEIFSGGGGALLEGGSLMQCVLGTASQLFPLTRFHVVAALRGHGRAAFLYQLRM